MYMGWGGLGDDGGLGTTYPSYLIFKARQEFLKIPPKFTYLNSFIPFKEMCIIQVCLMFIVFSLTPLHDTDIFCCLRVTVPLWANSVSIT